MGFHYALEKIEKDPKLKKAFIEWVKKRGFFKKHHPDNITRIVKTKDGYAVQVHYWFMGPDYWETKKIYKTERGAKNYLEKLKNELEQEAWDDLEEYAREFLMKKDKILKTSSKVGKLKALKTSREKIKSKKAKPPKAQKPKKTASKPIVFNWKEPKTFIVDVNHDGLPDIIRIYPKKKSKQTGTYTANIKFGVDVMETKKRKK